MRHVFNTVNIFAEPTPRIDARQFGSSGVLGGGNNGPLNAVLETEDGATLLETEGGQVLETEQ